VRERESLTGRLANAAYYISFPMGLLTFLLPVYGRMLGASPLEVGSLYSAFALATILIRPLVGRLADTRGRRPFILGGMASLAVTQLCYAFAQSYPWLLAARLVQGVGASMFMVAAYAAVADVAGADERGYSFGRVTGATARGGLVGALIGFGLFPLFAYSFGGDYESDAILAAFVLYFVLICLSLFRMRSIPETFSIVSEQSSRASFTYRRGYAVLLGIVFITASAQAMLPPVLITFMQDHVTHEVPLLATAYIPAAIVWSYVPARAGRLSDRAGRRLLLITGLAGAALVSTLLPRASTLACLSLLWAVEAGALSLALPAEQALVSDLTGEATRGRAFGFYQLSTGLGRVVGPLAGTALYQVVAPTAPFYFNAAGLLLGAGLVLAAGGLLERSLPRNPVST